MADDIVSRIRVELQFENLEQLREVQNALSEIDSDGRQAAKGGIEATEKGLNRAAREAGKASKAVQGTSKDLDSIGKNLPRLRYALYDVSTTFAILGGALLGLSTMSYATAIRMERDFADVARTVGGDVDSLRKDFEALFTSMPVSWKALTEIGTLAGQLNVAAADVDNFTKLVAQFSATTDVSVEASATAFGRLSQLLGVVGSDYERLGSSILNVGVNSVATESQIIAISTQIAGIAKSANMSADEVFGLAASFASLGIAPELTRGTVTRLFTQIEVAISQGGDRLERFAAISGQSADDFSNAWGTRSSGVIQSFLDGLGAIEQQGGSAAAALRSVGISSVRDVPALLRLAQSSKLVARNFQLAREGWEANTELANQYSVIAETTAAKIEVLSNKFQTLVSVIGDSGTAFGWLLDSLGFVLDVIRNLASNPVSSWVIGLTVAVTALTGAFFLFVGLLARGVASIAAWRTAQNEMTVSGEGLISMLTRLGAVLRGNSSMMTQNAVATRDASNANKEFTASSGAAGVSAGKLSGFLGKAGLAGALASLALIGMEVIGEGVRGIQNLVMGWAGASRPVHEYASALKLARDESRLLGAEFKNADFALDTFISKAGEFDFGDWLGSGDLFTFGASGNMWDLQMEQIANMDEALASLAQTDALFATNQFGAWAEKLLAAGFTMEQIAELLPRTTAALGGNEKAYDQAARKAEAMADTVKNAIDDTFAGTRELNKVSSAVEAFGKAFQDQGVAIYDGGKAFDDVISAIASYDPSSAAANLQAFFDFLVAGTYASVDQLIMLQEVIAALGGATGAATLGFNGFSGSMKKAGKSAGGASRQVRTLLDYASDLAQVMSRAFDIRFGSMLALDNITRSWRDLNEEIESYRRQVAELTAERNIQAYFLQVAEAYGDTLRADALSAEIAKLNADIAKAQAKASTSLNGNSDAAIENRKRITGLVTEYADYIEALAASGASQAAVKQATKDARADFIAQAQAMGYSGAELQKYIKHFDDMTKAVDKVPRNITVKADTDPAIQALNELKAKASKSAGSAGAGAGKAFSDQFAKAIKASLLESVKTAFGGALKGVQLSGSSNPSSSGGGGGGSVRFRFYRDGGFTGPGPASKLVGGVHAGEYVVPKHHVNQSTGTPSVAFLTSMMRRGYQSGGHVTPRATAGASVNTGMGLIELGPNSIREIARAMNSRQLVTYIPDVEIAQATARGSKQLNGRGVVG